MKAQKFQRHRANVIASIESADNTLGFKLIADDAIVAANFGDLETVSAPYTVVGGGAARGGTTILSYILAACGLYMGSNYGGEDKDFLENRFDPVPLTALIEARNAAHQNWGFKIPGLNAGQYGFFDESLRNPVFVFIFRSPFSTATSVLKRASAAFPEDRDGFGRATFGALTSYIEFTQFARQTSSPLIIISMEGMKKNPEVVVRELVKLLGFNVSEERLMAIAEQISVSGYKTVASLPA